MLRRTTVAHRDGISENFLAGVYQLCWVLAALVSGVLLFFHLNWAVSFVLGAALSVFSLRSIELVVRKYVTPDGRKPMRALGVFVGVKYSLIAVLFFVVARLSWFSAPALAGGLGLVYVTISLKGFWIGTMQLFRG